MDNKGHHMVTFLSVAESSQHDQMRTGNRSGVHGRAGLKLLDFGRRWSAFSREISWAAASLLGTFATDETGEREFGFGGGRDRSRTHDGFPFPSKLSRERPAFAGGSHVTIFLPERSKQQLPTISG